MNIPNKETSMLCDVQYVKQNKRENKSDYLYLIWRDLDTQEKFMQAIPEPMIDIYFEKPEFRNHAHNLNYQRIEKLDKKTVKYKDIIYAIAEDAGENGKRFLNNAFETRNYSAINRLHLYPYVFASDVDCTSWYRIQWLRKFNNERPKKLHKGFMDIEVDGFEVVGWASPADCPINAVSLIDGYNKTVYCFVYTDRPYIPKDTTHMTPNQIMKEEQRKQMYEHMHNEQHYIMDHVDELQDELHELFDEKYPGFDYKFYFYQNDEKKMLVHLFQLINQLKMDFIGIWNISFDIPFIIDRLYALGLNPANVMCHPDFPVKECYFKADTVNHDIKNKTDFFRLSSYSVFIDQMENYANIRKGQSELRSYKLNDIGERELGDTKLDYSEDGDIKTLPYTNFKKFLIYNIKDTLLQYGIEERTTDMDTFYVSSYLNATSYEKVSRQTVKLKNVAYLSFLDQGLIPGNNINVFNMKEDDKIKSSDEDDDDENDSFEGALVADPQYNGYEGLKMYGRRTNNVFANAVDFDMSAFYPSSIFAMNIDPSTLIFKTIVPIKQYDICGGNLKYKGLTKDQFGLTEDKISDAGKELFDNFQTGNYLTTGNKWLNMPNVDEVYKRMKKELG